MLDFLVVSPPVAAKPWIGFRHGANRKASKPRASEPSVALTTLGGWEAVECASPFCPHDLNVTALSLVGRTIFACPTVWCGDRQSSSLRALPAVGAWVDALGTFVLVFDLRTTGCGTTRLTFAVASPPSCRRPNRPPGLRRRRRRARLCCRRQALPTLTHDSASWPTLTLKPACNSHGKMGEPPIPDDSFSCPVCFEFMIEPVSTACGHTFCASCWPKCDSRCPVCRESIHGVLHTNIMIRELIRQQAPTEFRQRDVELNGAKLLRAAADEGNQSELVRLIREMREHADWDSKLNGTDALGRSPLFLATKHGRFETVKALLAVRACANQANQQNVGPLYVAALKGFVDIAAALIKSNAAVEAAKRGGISPLLIAAHEGHVDIVKLLLDSTADPNRMDDEGGTAMFAAASQGHLPVVGALLAAGLPQAPNKHNVTPLHAAAFSGHVDVVKSLLSAQAMIDSADRDGHTPLFLATQQGHDTIADLLVRSGAGPHTQAVADESRDVDVFARGCCCWPASWQRLQ